MTRDERQKSVAEWCARAFGDERAPSVPQRAVRMLEEAIELYQACGGDHAMAHKLIDFVFARPSGDIAQEIGGVGITLLALAQAAWHSADDEEARELDRVLSKPLEHFRARNEAKNAAGFEVAPPLKKTKPVMTPQQIALARNALGLPNKNKRSYGNVFFAAPGHVDYREWTSMVDAGSAQQLLTPQLTSTIFSMTPAGAKEALLPGEQLDPEDFPA